MNSHDCSDGVPGCDRCPNNPANYEHATDSVDDLLEMYPTREEMAEELSYRISESLELRRALATEKERVLPDTTARRIRELERDLERVNARLAEAQAALIWQAKEKAK